jgi:competence protein ComEC
MSAALLAFAGRYRWRILFPVWAMAAGLALTLARAEHRLADALDPINENEVSRVVLRVAELPRLGTDTRQFVAEVISSIPAGVPSRVQVSWAAPNWAGPYGVAGRTPAEPYAFPVLIPGQVWRMALTLKKPHGAQNLAAFDYEGHAFAHGVRASGSVRGTPHYLRDEPWAGLPVMAQRARHYVRAAMLPYLEDKRYGAVLLALAIGDQASVGSGDWTVFNRTGITHLVSISGSHITMIAALAGALTLWGWRRVSVFGRPLAERLPAQIAATVAALVIAWLYCLLAGWGVPARRTFLMLTIVALAYAVRLPLDASRLLTLVAFAVVLLDPWALFASGFWLSFGAVYVLMASAGWGGRAIGGAARERRWLAFINVAAGLQLAITVGLMPLLALVFHEVSLASPMVNAYAIPVISLVVTPLSLLVAGFSLLPGLDIAAAGFAWAGHAALDAIMAPTVWLAGVRAASVNVADAPLWLTALAIVGVAAAILPYGLPMRRMAWLLMLPALCWIPGRPPLGAWDLYVLDVGQASAVVVQTAGHTLLFDTGLRSGIDSDSAARVIWPFLRSRGVRQLDVLVVSHADIDHAGGARSMLGALPVQQSYSSFDMKAYLTREAALLGTPGELPALPLAMTRCEYGAAWQIDGVAFEFLWPLKPTASPRKSVKPASQRNAEACVLRIRGRHHSILLPGDIGARQEASLLGRGLGPVDVVVAAHHGSKSSSSAEFVDIVQARHAVAQAGMWNRYRHPSPSVQARWEAAGAMFWRTDRDGAVTLQSRESGLSAQGVRAAARRYWQGR